MNTITYRRTWIGRLFDVCNAAFMLLLFVVMLYPFLYVVNYSFSSLSQVGGSLLLLPQGFTTDVYKAVLSDSSILRALMISVLRSLSGASLMLLVTSMAAYVLSVPDLIFGGFLRYMFVLTMYVSAGVIPTYIFFKMYHLTSSFFVYILPGMCNVFNLILIKTYIENLPKELKEAVYIDGGSDLQAFWKVIFPVCLPVNAAVFLFGIVQQWNAFIDTQLYNATDKELYTLQYVLYNIMSQKTSVEALKLAGAHGASTITSASMKMAITVITIVPIMMVYPYLQKYFVSGIMIGSVKS